MFYIPTSIDGFYDNLHTVRRELNAILSGEIEWSSANDASCPLECEDNIMELDNFQAALSPEEYTAEDFDALCDRIERLQNEFSKLKEEICIASLSNHDWWSNCIGSNMNYLTERLLNNVPPDFIKINPYAYSVDLTEDELIDTFKECDSVTSVLCLACLARNGSDAAHDFLIRELNVNVQPLN